MKKNIFPWMTSDWDRWYGAFLNRRDAHAWLIEGQEGIGKVAFARTLAAAALCEAPAADGLACGHCTACHLLAAGTHPDLILVRPALLALAEGAADESDTAEEGSAESSDRAGDSEPASENSRKKASRGISIVQIRALADFAAIAASRGGRRVALIYPAEAMPAIAANALLKTLEEPTPGLMLLLVSAAPHRLLPTLRSRCLRLPVAAPTRDVALAWLNEQASTEGAVEPEQTALQLDAMGGAPMAVLDQLGSAYWPARAALIATLARGAELDAFTAARALDTEIKRNDKERQQGETRSVDLRIAVGWLQRWMHDVIRLKCADSLRYHRSEMESAAVGRSLRRAADTVPLQRLLAYDGWLRRASTHAHHPVNALLFLEDCLLRYRALF